MNPVDLRSSPALRRQSLVTLNALAAIATLRRFEPGSKLCVEGQLGAHCYLLLSGKARVSVQSPRGTVEAAVLGPGELIGHMALLDDSPRSATVVISEAATALVLPRETFLALLHQATPLGLDVQRQVAAAMVRQLRTATAQFVELKRKCGQTSDLAERRRVRKEQRQSAVQAKAALGEPSITLADLQFAQVVAMPGQAVSDEIRARRRVH